MSEWTIEKILHELNEYDGIYKREAVDAAIVRKDEIIPHLIKILDNILENPEKYVEDKNFMGHMYAVKLLEYFKVTEAHKVIVDVFSMPNRIPSDLFGDSVTEDLPMILFRTCGGNVEDIKSLITNREAYDYCRASACTALNFAVIEGMASREEVLEFYASLLTEDAADEYSDFWGWLVHAMCKLYPEKHLMTIKRAFDNDLIQDAGFLAIITYEEVEDYIDKGLEACLEGIRETFNRFSPDEDNFHSEMEWWAAFGDTNPRTYNRLEPKEITPPKAHSHTDHQAKTKKKKTKNKIAKKSRKKNKPKKKRK
ncbi:MAG TPA: DUF1186 domain-containing protein [Bacteroidetes bacterium]|nr:DUF1186 domain-containing protein [Bacteroidota bacterium]